MSGSTPQKLRKVIIFPQEKKGELNGVNSQYSGTENIAQNLSMECYCVVL